MCEGVFFYPGGKLKWNYSWGLVEISDNQVEALDFWQGLMEAFHRNISQLIIDDYDSHLIPNH